MSMSADAKPRRWQIPQRSCVDHERTKQTHEQGNAPAPNRDRKTNRGQSHCGQSPGRNSYCNCSVHTRLGLFVKESIETGLASDAHHIPYAYGW